MKRDSQREYRLKERAQQQAETRRRIIEAHDRTRDAVDLVRQVQRKVAGKGDEVLFELGQLAERRETLLAE